MANGMVVVQWKAKGKANVSIIVELAFIDDKG
jgi:hypothetical protein